MRTVRETRGARPAPAPAVARSWRLCLEALSCEGPGEDLVGEERKSLFSWLVGRGELRLLRGPFSSDSNPTCCFVQQVRTEDVGV